MIVISCRQDKCAARPRLRRSRGALCHGYPPVGSHVWLPCRPCFCAGHLYWYSPGFYQARMPGVRVGPSARPLHVTKPHHNASRVCGNNWCLFLDIRIKRWRHVDTKHRKYRPQNDAIEIRMAVTFGIRDLNQLGSWRYANLFCFLVTKTLRKRDAIVSRMQQLFLGATRGRKRPRPGAIARPRVGRATEPRLAESRRLDLPRFRGQLRSWDQATASDVMASSFSCSFFCLAPSFRSAPAEPILPSRPAHSTRRRAQGRSRSRTSRAREGLTLTAPSPVAGWSAPGKPHSPRAAARTRLVTGTRATNADGADCRSLR